MNLLRLLIYVGLNPFAANKYSKCEETMNKEGAAPDANLEPEPTKGGLISESFLLWLKSSKKNGAKSHPIQKGA